MAEQDDRHEHPHPIGWISSGGGGGEIPPPAESLGSGPAPEQQPLFSDAPTASSAAQSPWPSRRRRIFASTLIALIALTIGVAGAAIGHEVWTNAATPSNTPGSGSGAFANPNPFGRVGFGGNGFSFSGGTTGGSSSTSAGAPANASAIAAKVDPALVDVNSTFGYLHDGGAGTGIVLSSNGEVITNNHVVDAATKISVTDIGNGKTYSASVVGYDPSHDLAVLQLQGASGLKTASLGDSNALKVGDGVVALGNAGGVGGTPSSAAGSITALNQSITAQDEIGLTSEHLSGLIATNADIQSGDSGGPLVNASGQVIGIDTAGSGGFAFQTSSSQGFAIPIDQALATARQIEAGQSSDEVHVGPTGFLGVYSGGTTTTSPGGIVSNGNGFSFSLPGSSSSSGASNAATLSGVISGTPAAQAGLAGGDTITSLDGQSVGSWSALAKVMLGLHPGQRVELGWKDASGASHSTTVTLASGPAA